jgi:hypothetical protein
VAPLRGKFQWRLYVASSSDAFTWQVPVTPLRGRCISGCKPAELAPAGRSKIISTGRT